jgi:large subunit ribosomal protein L24
MARHPFRRQTRVPDVRRGDTVLVLVGKDAGKKGTVQEVIRPTVDGRPYRILVEGVNIAKRHTKPRMQTSSDTQTPVPGGIIDKNMPFAISKVMLVCPSCSKPTRVGHGKLDDGRRVRVCGQCNERVEVKA